MEKDLIAKIETAIAKKVNLKEEDVRSLMILIRKLLDKMPQPDQNLYLIMRLFCNWMVHIEITQSNTGLRILSEINDAFVSVKNSTDTTAMRTKMSEAIGFSALRKELKSFFSRIGIEDILVSDYRIWAVFISNLIEIVRDVPLSFPQLSELDATKQKIYNKIAKNPIKPGAGVISIQISRIDYTALGAQEAGNIMCLLIRTEDTTTTVIPLLIDVRQ